jgi:superfamily II DNA or RNA helicase
MDSSLTHPETPPDWLEQWPDETALKTQFPPRLREMAWRATRNTPPRALAWTADALTCMFGVQRVTWRWRDGDWRRSCTCGYVNDCCVHAWAVARLFTEIVRERGWRRGAAAIPILPPARPLDSLLDEVPRAAPPPPPVMRRPVPVTSGSFFIGTEPARARPPALASTPVQPALFFTDGAVARPALPLPLSAKLEVEADFHHEPGAVTLRFYQTVNAERRLLRLQQLLNLCLRVRHSEVAAREWSEDDRCFLAWLAPRLDRRLVMRENLQVHKLARDQFDAWLAEWLTVPGRFIERASQRPVVLAGAASALHVELDDEADGWVRLTAVATAPTGRRFPLHELFADLAAGRTAAMAEAGLAGYQPPLGWDRLKELFGRKAPRMRREHVAEHLPVLLDGRLDLLRGPTVSSVEKTVPLTLEVAADGAGAKARLSLDGLTLTPERLPAAAILDAAPDGAGWVVTRLVSPELSAVRGWLVTADAKPDAEGWWRVPGTAVAMGRLAEGWNGLPSTLERCVTPELAGLFGPAIVVAPSLRLRDGDAFVDLAVEWRANGLALGDDEVRVALKTERTLIRARAGGWLKLDLTELKAARGRLADAGLDEAELASEGARLFRPEAVRRLAQLTATDLVAVLPDSRPLAERLRRTPPPWLPELPEPFPVVLREYQKDGFNFLNERCAWGVGAILADDMGLGKTLQALALLAARAAAGLLAKGALVVCPASVTSVWREHAARFCPRLRCAVFAGTPEARAALLAGGGWDLLVVNYALLRQDAARFVAREFAVVVLDEAQQIKNPEAQVARAARALRTECVLALTGTPLENRALDLWSIMECVNPRFLGDRDHFIERYEVGADRRGLARRVAPVLLRRLKEQVARELPPRTEEVLRVELDDWQREFYDRELLRAREMVRRQGPIGMLAALTRLRQVCCDPRMLPEFRLEAAAAAAGKADGAAGFDDLGGAGGGLGIPKGVTAAKLASLAELAGELAGEGHCLLVFSQFTRFLALAEPVLQAAGMRTLTITGATPIPERERLVREFQDGTEPTAFLLSLKAAGTGLTLTRAGYVVIADPWWNPAVERQAIDRTHRIGQDKPVMAYRLVAAGTIEEKVLALQQEKAELFRDVIGAADGVAAPRLTPELVAQLLQ